MTKVNTNIAPELNELAVVGDIASQAGLSATAAISQGFTTGAEFIRHRWSHTPEQSKPLGPYDYYPKDSFGGDEVRN